MNAASRWAAVLIMGCLLATARPGTAQQEGDTGQTRSPDTPVFGVSSAVVEVDVVVRDKKGNAIRDLTAADFELSEDGEQQTIESFRIVSLDGLPRGERVRTTAPARPAAEAPSEPAPEPAAEPSAPSVIAFLFDRLSVDARKTAHKAASRYLESGYVAGDLVGVFAIDLALHTLQPFTPNTELVSAAFDRALMQGNTDFASTRQSARENTALARSLQDQAIATEDQGAAASLGAGAAIANTQARMARAFDRLERDQQGFATTNGLMAIVNGLKPVPGRKTVMFFSEGLALPAGVLAQFRSVIAEANRAQVSVYTVDAGGLRTDSGTRESRQELLQHSQQRLREVASGLGPGGDGPAMRGLERAEDNLRLNPDAGLGQLANETGGFHIRDSNDPSKEFGRIQEDMRFHYVLSYTPTNARYDGRFRQISVRVARSGARIQSRKGYFAVDPATSVPVRSFEAPALAELERDSLPRAFDLGTAALSFPEQQRPGRTAMLVRLPGSAVTFQAPVGDATEHEADFCVVVRVRNEDGVEVDRLSQQYLLSVPPESLDAARKGDVLFFKEANLPPGDYTVEAVAYDALSRRASARRDHVVVPEAGALRLSSLTLVGRAEQLPSERQQDDNPLIFGEMILYPNLGAPVSKTAMPGLPFYFTSYGPKPSEATLELLQGGNPLAALPMELPQPDARGRIQYAGTLPLESLPPGDFSLRLKVSDGTQTASREAPFTVTQ